MANGDLKNGLNPIAQLARKNNLAFMDLARALRVSMPTMRTYITDPYQMRLKDLTTLAGLFGINVLELFYLISRNRPLINRQDKWFIEEIKNNNSI